jgi:hypothetical protein
LLSRHRYDPSSLVGSDDPSGLATSFAELRAEVRTRGGGVLFAGIVPRILWNGLCVGAASPLRSTGFYWVRDGLILQLFDHAAGGPIGLG